MTRPGWRCYQVSMPARTFRIPALPAAARKAGATQIARCDRRTFTVGFAIVGEDLDAPGNGPAVEAALRAWGENAGFDVSWRGSQKFGIILTAREAVHLG